VPIEQRRGLRADRVAAQLAAVREEIAAGAARSGRDPAAVELLAAIKYVASEELPVLAEGGIVLVGENRAQELLVRHAAHGERFCWDFIGQLQSRKVRQILPLVDRIHSLASESALSEIARHASLARPGTRLLLEVNIAGEAGKAGIAPADIERYREGAALPVTGLMTMPPASADPQASRRWFAALRELAEAHGLAELSMGTSQDYVVAVEEGATIVRVGSRLFT
jgi:uncharacterized pyridoxal phosphate-containing UPF0001 family protein